MRGRRRRYRMWSLRRRRGWMRRRRRGRMRSLRRGRPCGLRRSALSHRRLAEMLGVAPTVELDTGLAQTLPYYRRQQQARLEAR